MVFMIDSAMGAFMSEMGAMTDAEVGAATYEMVEEALADLRMAVENAIERDRAEADRFLTELLRVMKHTIGYFREKERFDREVAALLEQVHAKLRHVETMVRSGIGPHAQVPALLERDAQQWSAQRTRVEDMRSRAEALLAVPGWSGASYDNYAMAGQIQVSALKELSGVMLSTSRGCVAGALLNRAVFHLCKQELSDAVSTIRRNDGSGSAGAYYTRTVYAAGVLDSVIEALTPAVEAKAAEGAAGTLTSQMDKTVSMPVYLQPDRWPTGTEGVGRPTADTGSGVNSDDSARPLNTRGVSGRNGSVGL